MRVPVTKLSCPLLRVYLPVQKLRLGICGGFVDRRNHATDGTSLYVYFCVGTFIYMKDDFAFAWLRVHNHASNSARRHNLIVLLQVVEQALMGFTLGFFGSKKHKVVEQAHDHKRHPNRKPLRTTFGLGEQRRYYDLKVREHG